MPRYQRRFDTAISALARCNHTPTFAGCVPSSRSFGLMLANVETIPSEVARWVRSGRLGGAGASGT